jgi:adenylylsulfate kinase
MPFVLWITGLPGSGKTTIAKRLIEILKERGVSAQYIGMDEIRRLMVPKPSYTEEERDIVYRAFVLIAKLLYEGGVNVVLDATGHRRRWRTFARDLIPHFVEVYVKCPIEVCMRRETEREQSLVKKRLYLDALKRLRTGSRIEGLGEVPGVDVPYEESPNPDLILEGDRLDPVESAMLIYQKIVESNEYLGHGNWNRSSRG